MEALTMKFKYDKSKGLLFFINPLLPVKGYSFMNICAIMFTRSEDYIKRMSQATVTHEKTHTKQILEMGIVFFYLWYVLEWFVRLFIDKNGHTAYRNISPPSPPTSAAEHPEYKRKTFSYGWLKWIL